MRPTAAVRLLLPTLAAAVFIGPGCATSVTRPAGAADINEPRLAESDEFKVFLASVAVGGRRRFALPGDASNMVPFTSGYGGASGWGLEVTILVFDATNRRIYRVADGSAVHTVLDDRGRELLRRPAEPLYPSSSQQLRAGFFSPLPAEASPPRNRNALQYFTIRVPVSPIPSAIRRIAGTTLLDVVADESELSIPVESVGEAHALAPGTTATLKLIEVDEKTGITRRASVEILTIGADSVPGADDPPLVQAVELLDAAGTTLGTLQPREEVLVGRTLRRRFAFDEQSSRSRPEPRPPVRIRVRTITSLQRITIPFEWTDIQLIETPPPSPG